MTDTHRRSPADAGPTAAPDGLAESDPGPEGETASISGQPVSDQSTELTGTAVPAAEPALIADETATPGAGRSPRWGRGLRRRRRQLLTAVIEEVDAARGEDSADAVGQAGRATSSDAAVSSEPAPVAAAAVNAAVVADEPPEAAAAEVAPVEDAVDVGVGATAWSDDAPNIAPEPATGWRAGWEPDRADRQWPEWAGGDSPAPTLVAPPAHSSKTAESVPTWTFGTVVPEAGDPVRPETPGEVISGRIDPDVHIPVAAAAGSLPMAAAEPATPGQLAPSWTGDVAPPDNGAGLRRASFGPAGKRRSPALVVILSILTLGLYGLVWHARTNREMGDFDPRMHVSSGRSTWAIVPPWIIGLGASAAGAVELVAGNVTHTALPVTIATPYAIALACGLLLVPYATLLIPFSTVAVVMTMERIRVVEEHVGLTTDVQIRPARAATRLLLPLIGGLSAATHQQRRLNRVWDRITPGQGRGRQA